MLLTLSEYFQPLNFVTLTYFTLIFLAFDIIGTFAKGLIIELKKNKDDETRILNWIIGLGLFVFVWFVLGFMIPPKGNPVLYSLIILSVISLPTYIKQKKYVELFKLFWSLRLPILIILPFLPAVFVKASLPPYYSDEMAYHFYSPADVNALGVWRYNGGLYSNLPRLFDTFFILIFSITKTYSVVRLFHFTVMATSMLFAFVSLKKNFGILTGLLFVFSFFSIPDDIIFVSTLGFVDIATISFMLMGFLTSINYLINFDSKSIVLSTIFWAMALGTKYTPITSVLSFAVPFLLITIKNKKEFLKLVKPKFVLILVVIFLIFGGYWYVKNFYFYGNPIYPFIFKCYRFASEWCGASSSFFEWTTPITRANLWPIMESLFPKNKVLQYFILGAPLLMLLNTKEKNKKISLLIAASLIIELLILKRFAGFYARYQQHMQLWALVLLAIQLSNTYKYKLLKIFSTLLFIVLAYNLIVSYVKTVGYTNSLRFLNWTEINYSIGKIDIYEWINLKMPRMIGAVRWCEAPTSGKFTPIARLDPDMIWYEEDGFMRSFLTNCNYENPPLDGIKLEDFYTTAKNLKLQFWTATPNKCMPQNEVVKKHTYESDKELYLRRLNNLVVCNAIEVKPNLYYFDYSKLTK